MAAKPNPLDAFASTSSTVVVQLSPLPKLAELVKANGFVAGIALFDEEMENWRQQVQQQLTSHLQPKATPPVKP